MCIMFLFFLQDLKVPWCSIIKSLPVYAIIVSNVTSDWGAYTLLINIPTYLKEVLQLDITTVWFMYKDQTCCIVKEDQTF